MIHQELKQIREEVALADTGSPDATFHLYNLLGQLVEIVDFQQKEIEELKNK